MAKQKVLKKSISSLTLHTIIDLDYPLGSGLSVRSFLLSHRSGSRATILGLDRDTASPSIYNVTTSAALRSEAIRFVQFLPIQLTHLFGSPGQGALSNEGLAALEDQYWDSTTDLPRSRFSDDLREDHDKDEGDIVFILENLPSDLFQERQEGTRPADTPFPLDTDNITHASFDTVGHSRPIRPAAAGAVTVLVSPPASTTLPPSASSHCSHPGSTSLGQEPPHSFAAGHSTTLEPVVSPQAGRSTPPSMLPQQAPDDSSLKDAEIRSLRQQLAALTNGSGGASAPPNG